MAANTRNSKVVALLVGSMTFGSALLLWLEPKPNRTEHGTPLVAQRGNSIESLSVEYVRQGEAVALSEYDAVVFPDGSLQWEPLGSSARLLVIGSADKRLPDAQARALLAVIADMSQSHSLDVRPNSGRVQLLATSDVEQTSGLPAQARHLRELLQLKKLIR